MRGINIQALIIRKKMEQKAQRLPRVMGKRYRLEGQCRGWGTEKKV